MAKAGRKRKSKPVAVAGGHTTMEMLNLLEREKTDKIIAVAMNNPLRRPFAGARLEHPEWLESALGRLCTVQRLKADIYDAAISYADIRRSWRAAIEAPRDVRLDEGSLIGLGPSRETTARWKAELDGCKCAIVAAYESEASGKDGFSIFERLVIDDNDLQPGQVLTAQRALIALAVHMGKTSARVGAFA
jgi:hypothetical protein